MDDFVLPYKLLKDLSHAADVVRGHEFIQIFSHYDADGMSAASILAKAMLRAGKDFRVTLLTSLDNVSMEAIKGCKAKCIIISDLGASYIKDFDAMSADIVVLDHHTVSDSAQRIAYVNPHLYGIDGMTSGCGATMALLFAVEMDETNWDLVSLAFAGIAGDRQHINGMLGLNIHLLRNGIERGFIEARSGSLVPSGNLSEELFLSTDPYVRGISGNREGVAAILKETRLEGRHADDLTDDEKRRLSSAISLRLAKQGVSRQTLSESARTEYYLTKLRMNAESLAEMFDACGRMGLCGTGVGAGIGDPECMSAARKLRDDYTEQILECVMQVEKSGLNKMKHIQWFDSSAMGFTGVVCGIAMQFIGDRDKPTVGINRSESMAKISSRGMFEQLEHGIDLSSALREACASVGGTGGGHRIASGGSCDASKIDQFLKNLDEIIGRQLARAK